MHYYMIGTADGMIHQFDSKRERNHAVENGFGWKLAAHDAKRLMVKALKQVHPYYETRSMTTCCDLVDIDKVCGDYYDMFGM